MEIDESWLSKAQDPEWIDDSWFYEDYMLFFSALPSTVIDRVFIPGKAVERLHKMDLLGAL